MVAGGTVVVAILGLYVSGVPFVGAMGLASAIVVAVTMLAALTLMPAFMGVAGRNVRALADPGPKRSEAGADGAAAGRPQAARRHQRRGTSTALSPVGAAWSAAGPWPWAIAASCVLVVLAIPLFSIRSGQPDNGTNPTSREHPPGLRPDCHRVRRRAATAR